MWLIYTWKTLEGKSHVLSSLANNPASQGYIVLCGSYTHGNVKREKVLSRNKAGPKLWVVETYPNFSLPTYY
jgi:hypothetical protein